LICFPSSELKTFFENCIRARKSNG
jgi:hypothetical protein